MKEEYEVTCGGRSEGKIGIGRGFYGSGVGLCVGGSDHPQSRLQRTHFFGDGFPDAFNQDAGDRVPDKSLRVTQTISRAGLGMANGRTSSFCCSLN